MSKFVSRRYGPVKRIVNVQHEFQSVGLNGSTAHVESSSDLSYDNGGKTAGFSLDSQEQATIEAIMEGLERYSSAFIYESDLCNWADLPDSRTLSLCDQYESEVDPTTLRYHKYAPVGSGKSVYLPAQYAYFPNNGLSEPQIIENTTNGLAAHFSVEDAIENAVYELVEREAILRFWLNRVAPPRIELSGAPLEHIETYLDERDLQLDVFRISLVEALPTVIVLLTAQSSDMPLLSFGASTANTLFAATKGAIEEALHMRVWQRKYFDGKPTKPDEITSIFDRAQYWSSEPAREKIRFVYRNERSIELGESDRTDGGVNAALADDAFPEMYWTDLTFEPLESEGIAVVRAICPSFHPFPLVRRDQVRPEGRPLVDGAPTDGTNDSIPHPLM